MTENKKLVLDFIDKVWNQQKIDTIADYITEDFVDHSLPPGFPEGSAGTRMWITTTGKSFRHQTIVDDILSEDNKVCVRIRMKLHHIGEWRGYAPAGVAITTAGYRFFELIDGRIARQWALIDGNRIEEEINGHAHSCRFKH